MELTGNFPQNGRVGLWNLIVMFQRGMSIENQHPDFPTCADIREGGFIRIPTTLPAPFLESGRLLMQIIEEGPNHTHEVWHAKIKGRYPTNEDFVFPVKTKLQK